MRDHAAPMRLQIRLARIVPIGRHVTARRLCEPLPADGRGRELPLPRLLRVALCDRPPTTIAPVARGYAGPLHIQRSTERRDGFADLDYVRI